MNVSSTDRFPYAMSSASQWVSRALATFESICDTEYSAGEGTLTEIWHGLIFRSRKAFLLVTVHDADSKTIFSFSNGKS